MAVTPSKPSTSDQIAKEHESIKSHDWHEAGKAWGHAPIDWACLYEHYAFAVTLALFTEMGIGPGVEVLEVACGAGLVAMHGSSTGAHWVGLDASVDLLRVARDRSPEIKFEEGSMFDLPFANESFDRVISINGVWGGCDDALAEANRVLRPGGLVGISFWGAGPPLDMKSCFRVFARNSPPAQKGSMKNLNNIAFDGVAERMMVDAGFDVVSSGSRISTIEWPDEEVAWRALASVGPAVPALQNGDVDAIRAEVMEAISKSRSDLGGYRFLNDHRYVVARKPM